MKATLESYGVDISPLVESETDKTTLAFVFLTENGEQDFTFYRDAHESITAPELSFPRDAAILHYV